MSGLDWMPSRAQAMRRPGLIGVAGHPGVDMPAHVVEAAAEAARRPAYPPITGTLELRAAIAERLGAELGRTIDPEREVLVTLGGMQGLHLAALAFGARTVAPAPSFFFPQLVAAAGGTCSVAHGWDEYASAVGPPTTLAIVNTPVNPTGYVLRAHDLDAIAAALAGSGALLLSDEAYAGVLYDGRELLSPASHPELAGRTLVLRSFSKTYGMAAWRIGFATEPAAVIETLAKAFAWQSLAIDAVAQAAALAAITGPQDWIRAAVAELEEMRPRAVAAANATGVLRAEQPEAAAFVWAAVAGDEEAWSDRLARDHRLPALPGRHFGARAPSLRIPFGGRPEAREAMLAELGRVRSF